MTGRRAFINQLTLATGAILLRPLNTFAAANTGLSFIPARRTLTIFHAAGLEGQWLPLEKPHLLHGFGGLENLQKELATIKQQASTSLVVQSGNVIGQHTSQEECNTYYKAVGALGFDVVVPGSHDLAYGREVFSSIAKERGLPVSLFQQSLAGGNSHLPWAVVIKNNMRIGTISVDGRSLQATDALNKTARMLKDKKCVLVVCVVDGNAKACVELAALSGSVDVMLTTEEAASLNTTKILRNKNGQEVMLSFSGYRGALLNRIDITLNEKAEKIMVASKAVVTGAETGSYAVITKRFVFNDV